jgi:hypothetical protein
MKERLSRLEPDALNKAADGSLDNDVHGSTATRGSRSPTALASRSPRSALDRASTPATRWPPRPSEDPHRTGWATDQLGPGPAQRRRSAAQRGRSERARFAPEFVAAVMPASDVVASLAQMRLSEACSPSPGSPRRPPPPRRSRRSRRSDTTDPAAAPSGEAAATLAPTVWRRRPSAAPFHAWGAPAVIARTRGALLLSCTQASVAELRRPTLAPDELRAPLPHRHRRSLPCGSGRLTRAPLTFIA